MRLPRRRRRPIGPEVIRASELTGISVKDLQAMGAQESTERLLIIGEKYTAENRTILNIIRPRKGDTQ